MKIIMIVTLITYVFNCATSLPLTTNQNRVYIEKKNTVENLEIKENRIFLYRKFF